MTNFQLSTLALTTLAATLVSGAFVPNCYDSSHVFEPKLKTKWDEYLEVQRVGTKGKDDGIISTVKTCFSADDGKQQPEDVCIGEITEAIVAVSFSSIAYHGSDGQTKRADMTNQFLESLGGLQVHAVYDQDKDVTANYVTTKRDGAANTFSLKSGDAPTKAVTALVSSKKTSDANTLPFMVSTNGQTIFVGHTEIDEKAKRDVTGWQLKSGSGVKILANSDPVAYYDDVVNWLNTKIDDGPYPTVLAGFISGGKGDYLGASLWDKTADGYYNGQWLAEVKHEEFNFDWEAGKNWCFGVHKSNCDTNANCPKPEDLPDGA